MWDDVLERNPRWVASFDAATRRLTRIARLNDAQSVVEKELFDLGAGIPVPDSFSSGRWWKDSAR